MAAEGRWVSEGDPRGELPANLAKCLWWIFAISDRLGADLGAAFTTKIENRGSGSSGMSRPISASDVFPAVPIL